MFYFMVNISLLKKDCRKEPVNKFMSYIVIINIAKPNKVKVISQFPIVETTTISESVLSRVLSGQISTAFLESIKSSIKILQHIHTVT